MYICPSSVQATVADAVFRRSFTSDVTSTADSFKSWDTCMDNKTCKIVAIVLIVLAGLFVFWILSTIIRCLCCGVTCLEALCCCCCRSANRGRSRNIQDDHNQAYNNPNMYPPPPPQQHFTSQPQPAYQPVYTGERAVSDEDPFNERKNGYRGHQF